MNNHGRNTLQDINEHELITLVGDIVSAFVSNNSVHASDLPQLIDVVHTSLKTIVAPKPEPVAPVLTPAVPVKKSITDDYLICLEDGKKFKSLKRHLQQAFGLSPDEYRAKWGLARDYPMVAPGYAAKRSQLAKESGLGSDRRKPAAIPPAAEVVESEPPAPAPEVEEVVAPKKRGRPRGKRQDLAA